MQALGCGPGPEVGAALRHLTECVLDDPSCNRPDRLRAALAQWARRHREQPGDDAAKTA